MTWTYSDNPASSDLDHVRFLIGDTDQDDPLLQNEEIQFCLDQTSAVTGAAANAAAALVVRFSRLASQSVGDISIQYEARARLYNEMYARFLAGGGGLNVFCGGISIAEREVNAVDTDVVQPSFTVGQMDLP